MQVTARQSETSPHVFTSQSENGSFSCRKQFHILKKDQCHRTQSSQNVKGSYLFDCKAMDLLPWLVLKGLLSGWSAFHPPCVLLSTETWRKKKGVKRSAGIFKSSMNFSPTLQHETLTQATRKQVYRRSVCNILFIGWNHNKSKTASIIIINKSLCIEIKTSFWRETCVQRKNILREIATYCKGRLIQTN